MVTSAKTTSCCINKSHENFNKIDENIVVELVAKGFKEEIIIDHVSKNNHSELYCYYHILKNIRESKPQSQQRERIKRNFKKISL